MYTIIHSVQGLEALRLHVCRVKILCVLSGGIQNFHSIRMDLKEIGSGMWAGLMWFMIGTSGRLF
jgi:hypothetical protein